MITFLLRDFITKIQVMFICLPKKEIFTTDTQKIIYPWYIDPPTHGIWPPTNDILTPYPWHFNPLPMLYRPPYPWYIDPPIHGILTPLPMVYRTPYPWNFDPSAYLLIRNEGSKYHGVQCSIQGGQYTMDENWPRSQFTMGVKIPYDTDPFFIHHLSPDL